MKPQYTTLAEATDKLIQRGYQCNFKISKKKVIDPDTGKQYNPQDLCITEFHRFEGMSNPSDMSVVYAIEANDGCKGTLIESFSSKQSNDTDVISLIPFK